MNILKRSELEKMSINELIRLFHDVRNAIIDKNTNKNSKVRLNKYLILINCVIAQKKKEVEA